jgi:hypothetical protein
VCRVTASHLRARDCKAGSSHIARTKNNKPPAACTPQRPSSVGPPQSVDVASGRNGYAKLRSIPSAKYALIAELMAARRTALSHQIGGGLVTGFVSPSHSERSHHSTVGACDDCNAYKKRAASVAGNETKVTHAPRHARRMRFTRHPRSTAIAAQSLCGAEA